MRDLLKMEKEDMESQRSLNSSSMAAVEVDTAKHPSLIRQVLACIGVYMFSISMGAGSGFSGVVIPQLQDSATIAMNENQISWFASIQTFAMVPTCVLGGLMGQYFGRRNSLLLIAPIYMTGFVCQAAANDFTFLLFGRFLTGAAAGLVSSPAGTYVSEVSTSDLRTTLGATLGCSYNLGMLVVFTLGAFCHWRVLAAVSAAFPALGFLLLVLLAPESPAWYVTQGRYTEASKSLQWLRGKNTDIRDEFAALKKSMESKSEDSSSSSSLRRPISERFMFRLRRTILRSDVYKPFCLILVVTFLQQFAGLATISFYAVNVLIESGSSINEYLATIIYGVTRLLGQMLGSFLLIHFQRRHLLVVSCIFTALGMSMLATSSYLNNLPTVRRGADNVTAIMEVLAEEEEEHAFWGYLPLLSVLLAALAYQIGLGPIPWSYMCELFPLDVRSFMSGVGNCAGNLYIFLVLKTFPGLTDAITLAGVYWLYSSVSLVTVVFTLTCLPETKGKGLEEIAEEFSSSSNGKKILQDSADDSEDS